MNRKCCSANRCAQIECVRCAKRYARRASNDFQARSLGPVFSIQIDAQIQTLAEFSDWRIRVRNAFHYLRATSRWWHPLSMRLWLCADAFIRGVIALGPITEDEFVTAFGPRWPTILRRIGPEAVFDELYGIVRPDSIMADDSNDARYQRRQMTVRPRYGRMRQKPLPATRKPDPFDEPMPLLIVS